VYKKTAVFLVCVVCFFVIARMYCFLSCSQVLINVRHGDSAFAIASCLKENKLIYSRNLFLCLVRVTNSQNKLRSGAYNFSRKDGMFKILKVLKSGFGNKLKFTIPEGSTVEQVIDIVSRTIHIDRQKFAEIITGKNLEGYLMPETYFVSLGMSEERLIEMMYKEFNKKITPDMYKRAEEMNIAFKDIIIMASIIEKEAVRSEERALISAVFYNRLHKKLRLQSCATVLRAIGVKKVNLSIKDTKVNSPYNTYIHFGLPPAPISNPGVQSIKTALYPANIDSLFFVSTKNGTHLFADTFDGHKRNRKIVKLKKQNVAK
jgi:UPF0755 protein